MSVYVDRLRSTKSRTGLKRWCKLWADTNKERAALANKVGLSLGRYTTSTKLPHYEITPEQREQSIAAGALMWSVRDWKHHRKTRVG